MRQGRLGLPDIQACSHAEQRKQWGALTSPLLVGRGGGRGGCPRSGAEASMHADDAVTAHDGALKASSEALQVLMIRGSRPPADRWYR